MQYCFLNGDQYQWLTVTDKKEKIYFKGYFSYGNNIFNDYKANEKLRELFLPLLEKSIVNTQSLKSILIDFQGQFSFVIITPKICFSAVDRCRNYQLVYHCNSQTFTLSNDAHLLKNKLNLSEFDSQAILEFAMSSYVSYKNKTLVKNIFQLEAGEFIIASLNKEKMYFDIIIDCYYQYKPKKFFESNKSQLIKNLYQITLDSFEKIAKTCDNRPIFLSLSAGLDSRLVACMLKKIGYKDVTCFTLGKPGNYEPINAEKIANHLGFNWIFTPTIKSINRYYYYSEDYNNYSIYADGLTSLPRLLNYFSICQLKKDNLIPDEAIFMNGDSGDYTAGKHIPLQFFESELIDLELFFKPIMLKHFNLWGSLYNNKSKLKIEESIRSHIKLPDRSLYAQDAASFYELWEWRNRQCKYAGQLRTYEFWNFEGRIPLWQENLMDFWANVPMKFKYNGDLYHSYLRKYNFYDLFVDDLKPKKFFKSRLGLKSVPEKILYYTMRPFFSDRNKPWGNIAERFVNYFTSNLQYSSLYPLKDVIFSNNKPYDGNSIRSAYHLANNYGIEKSYDQNYIDKLNNIKSKYI